MGDKGKIITGKEVKGLIKELLSGGKSPIKEEVAPKVSATETETKELKLPKFSLSDKWGNPSSEDRETIKLFTQQISGETIEEKINNINSFVTDCDSGCVEERKASEILSNLIILDSLSSLISDYNPLSGGFLMESFLSGIIGGKSEQVKSSEGKIEDIYNYKGEPLSVKFLTSGTPISGSKKLINDFIQRNQAPITYLLIQKQKEDKKVLGLKFFKFTVGNDEISGDFNVNQFPLKQSLVTSGSPIAELNFGSKEQLKAIANKYVDRLGERILVIFEELDSLSNNINQYLIGNDKIAGVKASSNAENLKIKINQEV